MGKYPQIGDIYMMQFTGTDSEQTGWRPGLVFQNNKGNYHSTNIIALPLTSAVKKTTQPTHVLIPSRGTGLLRDSVVLCENPERMAKSRMGAYITTLSAEYMEKIAIANIYASSAISFIDPAHLQAIWTQAAHLNVIAATR